MDEAIDLGSIDWHALLPKLGVDPKFLSPRQGPCPLCGGNTRFRFDNKQGHGTWFCNHCRAGNGLTLVARVNGWTHGEAAKAILEGVSVLPRGPVLAFVNKEPSRDELKSRLQRVWDKALPVTPGDPVHRYLTTRIPGFGNAAVPAVPAVLRHHPALDYFEPYVDRRGRTRYRKTGTYPAMIAKIADAEGRPVNLHRTYLTADGRKAPVPEAKKTMKGVAKMTGGAIRLTAPASRLALAEGIETTLAVRAASHHRLAVWSCVSAGLLANVVLPSEVTEVHVYADHDKVDARTGKRAGHDAAEQLRRRLVKEGRKVVVHMPEHEGEDFLDVYVARTVNRCVA